MASNQEAQEAIYDAIVALTAEAKASQHHAVAFKWAAAVNQLAEARAWLNNPGQPHGGVSIAES